MLPPCKLMHSAETAHQVSIVPLNHHRDIPAQGTERSCMGVVHTSVGKKDGVGRWAPRMVLAAAGLGLLQYGARMRSSDSFIE